MSKGIKLLISGTPNSGKSSLCKGLEDSLVLSRDGKKFPFLQPHKNMEDFDHIDSYIDEAVKVIKKYKEKFKVEPKYVVLDSISRVFLEIEKNCNNKYKNYDVWKNVGAQTNELVDFMNELTERGIHVVIIAHAVWNEESGEYTEVLSGKFAKTGFLSTVDYALFIQQKAGKFTVNHRKNNLSRTLMEDIPDKQNVDEFNLKEYLEKIIDKSKNADEWSFDD